MTPGGGDGSGAGNGIGDGDGIVFGATGPKYNILARRAALTARRVMPDLRIDLYTDRPGDHTGPPFDRVHGLTAGHGRPKFEALARSRFARTLYLDCDVVMVAEIAPVFEVLRRFDIVGAHEQFGCAPIVTMGSPDVPAAGFRQINGGVLGLSRSPGTDRFLADYLAAFLEKGARFDQPILAEQLYRTDLRLAVLPPEYNLMFLPHLRHAAPGKMMAPRLLHLPVLHKGDRHLAPADAPFDLGALLNKPQLDNLRRLVAQDITLGAKPSLRHATGDALRRAPWLDRKLRQLLDRFN